MAPNPHGRPPGQAKKDKPPAPPAGGGATAVVFAVAPEAITSDGNKCRVSGLQPGRDFGASTHYESDDGSAKWDMGSSVEDNGDGSYSWWITRAYPAAAGKVHTWLHEGAGAPFSTPPASSEGVLLEWDLRYEGA
jgi:hypothetical protein